MRLNREILRLSLPSILANMTVPLVGMVDTAVAGHLPEALSCSSGAAAFIGAISLGAMIFNLLYWNCSFLRTGTGGLTAQAFGRGDMHGCASIFMRGMALTVVLSLGILLLQWPIMKLALLVVNGSSEVESLAARYFLIRIWAAPATLALMTFSGWFVGMQDSVSSMWKDLVVNAVNVVASIVLALGAGSFKGMGFAGVALGTVIAQYSGLLFCVIRCRAKYGKVLSSFIFSELRGMFGSAQMRGFFRMNVDLVLRSLSFTAIYIGYTVIAAGLGDMILACSSIMMQLLMIFSYFTDGFAYAGEALTGRFIGAGDRDMMRRSIRCVFAWSMGVAFLFIGVYRVSGVPLLRLMTSDTSVVETCTQFLPWLLIMPPVGCAAFTWDGICLGATATAAIRNSMLGSAAVFLAVWFAGPAISGHGSVSTPESGMHLLLAAYFAHLIFRTFFLTVRYFRRGLVSGRV